MKIASFWQQKEERKVVCGLCRFFCVIAPGKKGRCHVRQNVDGTLYSLVYGRPVALGVDPVEKKPLYHVRPGHLSYSVATVGCNFHCLHCQNCSISQQPSADSIESTLWIPAEEIVQQAIENGCQSIAYTYTEPTVFLEYVLDIARIAKKKGLLNLLVTNGYTSEEALRALAPWIDAANVDLKGFDEERHRALTGASVEGVKETLVLYGELGLWLEVTTLVIPGINDSDREIERMANFIVDTLGSHAPWHLSAFSPQYRMQDRPATSSETLRRARRIAQQQGLHSVYLGNLRSGEGRDTLCRQCGAVLIERAGYRANVAATTGRCPQCSAALAGLWSS